MGGAAKKVGRRYTHRVSEVDKHSASMKGTVYGNLEYWAQDGFICMEDQGTGEFYVLSRKDALERAQAVSGMNNDDQYPSVRLDMQRFCENMIECVKEAKSHGDLFDPKVQEWHRKHRPKPSVLLGPSPGSREWHAQHGTLEKAMPVSDTIIVPS